MIVAGKMGVTAGDPLGLGWVRGQAPAFLDIFFVPGSSTKEIRKRVPTVFLFV